MEQNKRLVIMKINIKDRTLLILLKHSKLFDYKVASIASIDKINKTVSLNVIETIQMVIKDNPLTSQWSK